MNNFDIMYAQKNFFNEPQRYSPSDFYSMFNSFCDYLRIKDLNLIEKLQNLENDGFELEFHPDESPYTTKGDVSVSALKLYEKSDKMAAAIENSVLEYIKEHIREYEPFILANHINLLEYNSTRENDFTKALFDTNDIYLDALNNFADESECKADRIKSIIQLPATDGNFISRLSSANEIEMNIALILMDGKEGNIARSKKISSALKKLEKANDTVER